MKVEKVPDSTYDMIGGLDEQIKEIREVNKFYSAFIDSIIRHAHKGRIHAEINQLRGTGGGTVTGRLSYSSPNLQQIPARNKELGPLIRSLFLPDEGCKWGCFAEQKGVMKLQRLKKKARSGM